MFTKEKKKKNRDFFFSRVSHTKNNYRVIISYNYTVIIFCVGNPAKIPPLQLFPDVNYGILKTPLLEGFWLEEIILRLLKFESIREVYKKQQQPIFFFKIPCCKNVKGEK